MRQTFLRLLKEDGGSSAAEYALVGSLIAIAIITGVVFTGGKVGGLFNYIGTQVSGLPSAASFLK